MSRRFKVGDRVRIVRSYVPERVGVVATIVGELSDRCSGCGRAMSGAAHALDIEGLNISEVDCQPGCPASYFPEFLVPIYDGNEKVSWSECAWKPAGVSA